MNWLKKALGSSIGRKSLMAVTGLLLCGFLAVHLAGNLLLYKSPESYNEYAHALHKQETLLAIAEIGLLALFVGHIGLALLTQRDNQAARPHDYAMKQSKIGQPTLAQPASAVMYVTGIVVLGFILLHLIDFRFELRNRRELTINPASVAAMHMAEQPFDKARRLLADPLTCAVYLLGSVVLGYHLLHGFQSAFQSLGWNHPKYTPLIKNLGAAFAVIVALGFASFPIWAVIF